jgi:hypothetical protein
MRYKFPFGDRFWVPVQFVALGSILVVTALPSRNSQLLPTSIQSDSFRKPVADSDVLNSTSLLSRPFRLARAEVRPRGDISSRVVVLPHPASSDDTVLNVVISTKQVRFERSSIAAETPVSFESANLRSPASHSQVINAHWDLEKLERKVGDSWESVTLIGDALGSDYLELRLGVNEFRVTFSGPRGTTKVFPIFVTHSRTNKT